MTASISASDLALPGTPQITVLNPPPGGGSSNSLAFVVGFSVTTNPVPALTSISPATALGGAAGFTLTLNGSNFIAGSSVIWNGSVRPTTVLNSGQLTASISASDVAAVGTAKVAVFNPALGGGSSNLMTFTITGPVIGSTVNGASFTAGQGVAPGSIASDFGSAFASPDSRGVGLQLNEIPAFLFGVYPDQINFQVPWELAGQTKALVTVSAGGAASSPVPVSLATYAPGIFSTSSSGSGQGAVLISNSASIASPIGTFPGSRPASRGDFISVYCTGLGPVTNQPATGVAASANPLSLTAATPTVTIGGAPAQVVFSGLAPGFVGLYQVNAQVPVESVTGDAVPLTLTIGGATANTVTIAVQ